MKKHLKTVLSLTVICAVIAILLAVVNDITAPIIKEQEMAETNKAFAEVLPNGEDFAAYDFSSLTLPSTVKEVYSEKNGGYVFKMETTGYSSGFIIMCGIDKDGTVVGSKCISSQETLGYESTYGEAIKGANKDTIDSVDTISGATKTTLAYRNAVKDAINSFIIIGGGSVDIRDEAQILNDNLSAALPEADGKFAKALITEKLDAVDAYYIATNLSGCVLVVDDVFVGVDTEGKVVSDVPENVKTAAEADARKLLGVTFTDIDISKYENIPSAIVGAQISSNGNYVFKLKAAGYGINGDKYSKSGEYIYIRASATKDGEIIDCETISQKETDGIGSECANESFYGQFDGKTEANYKEIDAISGATVTTNGYVNAIAKIFEAIKILEGAK